MWALIGLILTIGGTFLEAFMTSGPWGWGQQGVQTYSLGINCQVGAVLLIGCLGGRNSATVSQIAYLLLGLAGFNIFTYGGGLDYIHHPTFGYLLGFVPAAWICGWLAFQARPRLENLAFSCFCGLVAIHVTGAFYLILAHSFGWIRPDAPALLQSLVTYSGSPLPGQLAMICAVTLVAMLLRRLMFY